VCWIARWLLRAGKLPAVVSRGYGGSAGKGPVLVSRGQGPLVGARVAGDEPLLMSQSLPGVRVVVGSDRVAGVEASAAAGADVAILDDGFQHRRLARDLDIVLLDSTDPFGGSRLLPAGRLREPVSSLARADVVLLTRSRSCDDLPALERIVRQQAANVPIVTADHDAVGFVDATGNRTEVGSRAVVFCGIGNPQRFRHDLERRGIEVVRFRAFRDHHDYSGRDLSELAEIARKADAALITTEKDMARLVGCGSATPDRIAALRIEAVIDRPQPLIEMLERIG